MSTSTFVISYAYTVTYVTTKMLLVLKEIIREIGLDPSSFTSDWDSYEEAISTWLSSRHLQQVTLEVYDPSSPPAGILTWCMLRSAMAPCGLTPRPSGTPLLRQGLHRHPAATPSNSRTTLTTRRCTAGVHAISVLPMALCAMPSAPRLEAMGSRLRPPIGAADADP